MTAHAPDCNCRTCQPYDEWLGSTPAEQAATVREAFRRANTVATIDFSDAHAALDALIARCEEAERLAVDYKADRDSYDELLGRKMAERDEWHNRAEAAEADAARLHGLLLELIEVTEHIAECADHPAHLLAAENVARAARAALAVSPDRETEAAP